MASKSVKFYYIFNYLAIEHSIHSGPYCNGPSTRPLINFPRYQKRSPALRVVHRALVSFGSVCGPSTSIKPTSKRDGAQKTEARSFLVYYNVAWTKETSVKWLPRHRKRQDTLGKGLMMFLESSRISRPRLGVLWILVSMWIRNWDDWRWADGFHAIHGWKQRRVWVVTKSAIRVDVTDLKTERKALRAKLLRREPIWGVGWTIRHSGVANLALR